MTHQEGTEVLLEPNNNPVAETCQRGIFEKIFLPVDIGSNVNAVHVAVLLILAPVAITSPIRIEMLTDWYNKRKET